MTSTAGFRRDREIHEVKHIANYEAARVDNRRGGEIGAMALAVASLRDNQLRLHALVNQSGIAVEIVLQ